LIDANWPRPPEGVDEIGTTEEEWLPPLDALLRCSWSALMVTAHAPDHGRRLDRLVVVSPHPDDETLGVGGLIGLTAAAGVEVVVLAVTDGEAAYGPDWTRLAATRRREQRRAVRRLASRHPGRVRIVRLGVADGRVAAAGDRMVETIAAMCGPSVLCVGPARWDGHPDHEAAGVAAAAASTSTGAVHAEYPIWAWHWAKPAQLPLSRAVRLDLPVRIHEAKTSAVLAHRSQIRPTRRRGQPVLPPHVLRRFTRPFEVLFR
jgi:LmbE family N-acetylglucosaminyl deacetylase